jgi:outer membrane autotransporter protein
MFRRADRIIDAAPDLSTRLSARDASGAGEYAANMDEGRYTMSLNASLAGARNQAKARDAEAPGMPSHMRDAQDVNRFDVWLSAELAGVTDDRAGERAESDFGVAQLGADWAVSDDLLIGGLVQFDWMDETAREIFEEAGAIAGARVDGEGWMAGPYVVWRMADRVVLDGLAMYGTSSNTVNPLGLYEDEFETDRWMVRANLTGEYGRGALLVRPQATLTHFEETQDGYTDSLGIVIPSQSIALGRLSAGPEFVWRQDRRDGAYWELRSKVRAVWDYQPAELLMESGQFSSADSEFRADGEVGVAATLRNGAQLELSVGLAGIGQSDFEATTARFNLRYPLSLGH